MMCDGSLQDISEIEEGEWVLTRDDQTGEVRCEQVVAPYHNPDRAIINVSLMDEAGDVETIETTFNHPFYVEGMGWTQVDRLREGDVIPSPSGWLQVVGVEWTGQYETVYNFGVEQTRSYFVGESGAWVHNCFEGGAKDALKHWNKHSGDFPQLGNAKEYVEEARKFINNPPKGAERVIRRRDGRTMIWDPKSNRFAVVAPDGKTPSTYFRLDATGLQKPGTSRTYRSNREYFESQQ